MNLNNKKNNKGFTLVELAIVIVIIGLLVGGVLQGQELITQAKIRSTVSAIQGYNAAVNTFRAKYNKRPGDLNTAAAMGVNCPKSSTCTANVDVTTTPPGRSAGDGDGNGLLQSANTSTAYSAPADANAVNLTGEYANFWIHLSNAQLTKSANVWTATTATVGTNYPTMPSGTGILAATVNKPLYWLIGTGATVTRASGFTSAGLGGTNGGSLSPNEAFGIDSKLDDGAPNTGIIINISGVTGSGTSATAGAITQTALTPQFGGTASSTACSGNSTSLTATTAYNISGTSADSKVCLLAVRADG